MANVSIQIKWKQHASFAAKRLYGLCVTEKENCLFCFVLEAQELKQMDIC